MQKPIQILSLETRLDNLVSKFDAQTDFFLQAHLARYLIIVTSGYFEQAIQISLAEFARPRAHTQIVSYVDTTISWEGSINRYKLERILGRFDKQWFQSLETTAAEAEKNAVDSVKELRDQLAHGSDNGTGYAVARGYHFLVRDYVGRLLAVLP